MLCTPSLFAIVSMIHEGDTLMIRSSELFLSKIARGNLLHIFVPIVFDLFVKIFDQPQIAEKLALHHSFPFFQYQVFYRLRGKSKLQLGMAINTPDAKAYRTV